MHLSDIKNPNERKKLVLAIGLGIISILFLWWTLIGFGGSRKAPQARVANVTPLSTSRMATDSQPQRAQELKADLLTQLQPISYQDPKLPVPEAKRNIFSFYEPPAASAKTATPTPTPTPMPPVLLAAASPNNVFARTSDFTLEVSGDKFTPALRVLLDGRQLNTNYKNAQQISAVVPAAMIANPGGRQVMLQSPDGKLYSNPIVLNVSPPPTPNYTYVGIIGKPNRLDTAIVQDKSTREIVNVQRGDVLGGRFRITSISEKELVLVDTNLKIKHTLQFSTEGDRSFNPQQRPTPKTEGEDDEP